MRDWLVNHLLPLVIGGTLVVLIGFVVWAAVLSDRYLKEHDCHRTGEQRFGHFIQMGRAFVPTYQSEYRCAGGETIWQ